MVESHAAHQLVPRKGNMTDLYTIAGLLFILSLLYLAEYGEEVAEVGRKLVLTIGSVSMVLITILLMVGAA